MRRQILDHNLFNTITTLGTPYDVGLQELKIEMSYPMDEATRAFLAQGHDGGGG